MMQLLMARLGPLIVSKATKAMAIAPKSECPDLNGFNLFTVMVSFSFSLECGV